MPGAWLNKIKNKITGKEYWLRARERKQNELNSIALKYRLHKDNYPQHIGSNAPYFDRDSFWHDAENYADRTYKNTLYVKGAAMFLDILKVTLILTLNITIAAFTMGTSLPANIAIITATLASTGVSLWAMHQETLASNAQVKKSTEAYKQSGNAFKENRQEKSNTLTSLIIYSQYDIYAGNALYNSGRAGDSLENNSYNPSQPYDPTRGIRGDLKQEGVEFDKSITYKNHTALAGNKDFYQNITQATFPIKTQGFRYDIDNTITQRTMNERLKEINAGISELINAEAGAMGGRHRDIESTSDPAKAYNAIISLEMGYYKNKFLLNDFLHKQERYKNGQWADFHYIYFKEATKQKEAQFYNEIYLIDTWNDSQEITYRNTLKDKALITHILRQMLYNMQFAIDILTINKDKIKLEIVTFRQNTYIPQGEELLNQVLHLRDIHTAGDILKRHYRFKYFLSDTGRGLHTFTDHDKIQTHLNQTPSEYHSDIIQHHNIFNLNVKTRDSIILVSNDADMKRVLHKLANTLWDNRMDSLEYKHYTLSELDLVIE